jgi:hypothetical protein
MIAAISKRIEKRSPGCTSGAPTRKRGLRQIQIVKVFTISSGGERYIPRGIISAVGRLIIEIVNPFWRSHMRPYLKLLSVAFLLTAASAVHAQQGPGGGPGGPDGGPPDPEEMRQMMDQRIKQAMNPTDDEWTKLQPLIDKVEELEHQSDTGPRMHGPPHPEDDQNGDNPDGDHPQSPVESAISKLKKVLSDQASTDDQIATATKAVEDAEKKVKDDLAAARKELKAIVNLRQQAVLVALGVLD